MLGPFKDLLKEDAEVRVRALETLIPLRLCLAASCLATIEGTDLGLVDNGDDSTVTALFDRAEGILKVERLDTEAKRSAAEDLLGHLDQLTWLLSEKSQDQRKADAEAALGTAQLVVELRNSIRARVYPRLKPLLAERGHDAGRESKCLLDYANALRREGAIRSDLYRNFADISQHATALRLEVEGLRTVLRVVGNEHEGYTWESLVVGDRATDVADALNAVGTSCYRIKRYDVAIPLLTVARTMTAAKGSKVVRATADRIANNYGAARYGFVRDCDGQGVSYPDAGWLLFDAGSGVRRGWGRAISATGAGRLLRDEMLAEAVDAYGASVKKMRESGSYRWEPMGNYAECLAARGDLDGAREVADDLVRDVRLKKDGSNDLARALVVRARVLLGLAKRARDAEADDDAAEADALLAAARADVMRSRELKVKEKGPFHVDVVKADGLLGEIDGLMGTTVGEGQAPGERLRARPHVIPSAQAVTNGIVRGEDLGAWDVLGMSEEDFERRFGGALGCRAFSIVEATPADAGVIADMMRGAQERMAGPWFKISDERRVRDKLAFVRGDGETGGDEAGIADGGTFGLLIKKGDQAVAYALFMKPRFDDTEENLAFHVPGMGEGDRAHAMTVDSLAVDPSCRGFGFQRLLVELGERRGCETGCTVSLATVHPSNTPSLRNFLQMGYAIDHVEEDFYGDGTPRAVLVKRLG